MKSVAWELIKRIGVGDHQRCMHRTLVSWFAPFPGLVIVLPNGGGEFVVTLVSWDGLRFVCHDAVLDWQPADIQKEIDGLHQSGWRVIR